MKTEIFRLMFSTSEKVKMKKMLILDQLEDRSQIILRQMTRILIIPRANSISYLPDKVMKLLRINNNNLNRKHRHPKIIKI